MRWLFLFAAIPLSLPAQSTLHACTQGTQEYVVGSKLLPSGLFLKTATGAWQHAGYNHPFVFGLDYNPNDPSTVYLAAGNGLIRASEHGQKWRILTSWDVTELRDVSIDRNSPGTIYFAYSHGIRVSHDSGTTWQEVGATLHRRYTESIRVDRRRAGVLLAGGEEGIFRSENEGKSWKLAGAAGVKIMRIEQSPHNPCFWLAATQESGLFASTDCGATFENVGRVGVGHNLYDISFDPTSPDRIAVASWGPGVLVSEDGGKTWMARNMGLPRNDVWSVAFDPDHPGRLYASIHERALYVSPDAGKTWTKEGFDGSIVYRMQFIPESVKSVAVKP